MGDDKPAEPTASRPSLPSEYGILDATEGKGLLPWSWATERLSRSRGYWIATTRPDGRPHMANIWGVFLHDRFYFETSVNSRKARNLAANASCVICPESADEAIVMEGASERVVDPLETREFAAAYEAKYQEEIDTNQFAVYSVQPRIVFASISDATEYTTTATRWRFSGI